MKEIQGDLIQLAKSGYFNLIAHGANCFCTMGSGIAKQIKTHFPQAYIADCKTDSGDMNKLGNYTIAHVISDTGKSFGVLNCYTQYSYGTDSPKIDYEALTLCMRKINHQYKGQRICLPKIGAGLAGGDWDRIKKIIETELKNMDVFIVHYIN